MHACTKTNKIFFFPYMFKNVLFLPHLLQALQRVQLHLGERSEVAAQLPAWVSFNHLTSSDPVNSSRTGCPTGSREKAQRSGEEAFSQT